MKLNFQYAVVFAIIGHLSIVACGKPADPNPPPARGRPPGPKAESEFVTKTGMKATFNVANFTFDGSDKVPTNNVIANGLSVEAKIVNPTEKSYDRIKLRVSIKWPSSTDKAVQEFEVTPPILCGGFMHGALPAGRFVFVPKLIVPIRPEQWQLGDEVDVEILGAREFNPGRDSNYDLNWQMAALTDSKDELLRKLEADPTIGQARNREGYSLMSIAIVSGDLEKVKALEARGFPLDDKNKDLKSPKHMAALANPEMVRYVDSKKLPRSFDEYGNYPITYSIWNGRMDTTKALLACGESPEQGDAYGSTAFMEAIRANRPEFVDFFGKMGVRTDSFNEEDMSPLSFCIFRHDGLRDVVFKYDKGLNRQSPRFRMTPLHFAVKYNRLQSAIWCIKHGARKDLKDVNGKIPADYVGRIGNEMDQRRMNEALGQ